MTALPGCESKVRALSTQKSRDSTVNFGYCDGRDIVRFNKGSQYSDQKVQY